MVLRITVWHTVDIQLTVAAPRAVLSEHTHRQKENWSGFSCSHRGTRQHLAVFSQYRFCCQKTCSHHFNSHTLYGQPLRHVRRRVTTDQKRAKGHHQWQCIQSYVQPTPLKISKLVRKNMYIASPLRFWGKKRCLRSCAYLLITCMPITSQTFRWPPWAPALSPTEKWSTFLSISKTTVLSPWVYFVGSFIHSVNAGSQFANVFFSSSLAT